MVQTSKQSVPISPPFLHTMQRPNTLMHIFHFNNGARRALCISGLSSLNGKHLFYRRYPGQQRPWKNCVAGGRGIGMNIETYTYKPNPPASWSHLQWSHLELWLRPFSLVSPRDAQKPINDCSEVSATGRVGESCKLIPCPESLADFVCRSHSCSPGVQHSSWLIGGAQKVIFWE